MLVLAPDINRTLHRPQVSALGHSAENRTVMSGGSGSIPLKNSLSVRLIWAPLALPMIMSGGFSALNEVIFG